MKKQTLLLILPALLITMACNNNKAVEEIKIDEDSATEEISGSGIVGEWEFVAEGQDKNGNGILEDAEITDDAVKGGFDYLHFLAKGTCVYDKKIEFDGTWTVKLRNEKNTIHIYPSGLPESLPETERDSNAFRYKIISVDDRNLIVYPAHLGVTIVVYKRI